mgnify:CR=1 FL=1
MPKRTYAPTRLSFLNDLLSVESQQKEKIANKLGITRQSLNAMLRVDDCRVSLLFKIADALDYDVKIEFDFPGKKNLLVVKKGPGVTDKKLQGLIELMKQKSLNTADMAKILGMTQTGFCYILQKDDTRMSNLYKIAEQLDAQLVVNITKKQQA